MTVLALVVAGLAVVMVTVSQVQVRWLAQQLRRTNAGLTDAHARLDDLAARLDELAVQVGTPAPLPSSSSLPRAMWTPGMAAAEASRIALENAPTLFEDARRQLGIAAAQTPEMEEPFIAVIRCPFCNSNAVKGEHAPDCRLVGGRKAPS